MSGSSWLLRGDEVLASAELADTPRARLRGLLGRSGIDGVMVIAPANAVHTVGMGFAIDVAYCRRTTNDQGGQPGDPGDPGEPAATETVTVLDMVTMAPGRVGRPRLRSHLVIEAPAEQFKAWDLRKGDQLTLVAADGTQS